MPTYKEYIKFCQQICITGVPLYTVEKACENINNLSKQFIIIKHDVEDKPEKALKISKIEHGFGITSTYYVHSFFLRDPKSVAILKEIISLGHEIGYHYDVLDSNDGNKNSAIREFEKVLSDFADNGLPIRTVCPHGNPLKKRVGYSSNKDFFLDPQIRRLFDNIVDVYITFPDLVDSDYLYITDAKYSYSYREAKTTRTDATEKLSPLDGMIDIIKMVQNGKSMIISTHTHRYFSFGCVALTRIYLYRTAKCIAKTLYKMRWGKYIIDKFYFIAKKI
ncbi:MAG: hypothetical protein WC454_00155 [Phycisphaerae bacterium]|jgi:hypothetical protein